MSKLNLDWALRKVIREVRLFCQGVNLNIVAYFIVTLPTIFFSITIITLETNDKNNKILQVIYILVIKH